MRVFAILFVLIAGASFAADDNDKKGSSLDGTWIMTGIQINGEKQDDSVLKDNPKKVVIMAGKWKLIADDAAGSGTIKVDATKTPAHLEVTYDEGPFAGKTMKGIFEIKGDSLRACYDATGGGRPKEFTTKDEPTHLLVEYKREKKQP